MTKPGVFAPLPGSLLFIDYTKSGVCQSDAINGYTDMVEARGLTEIAQGLRAAVIAAKDAAGII